MGMFPVFLEMADKLAIVIGGGSVGRRKARGLLASGARVRLVCLEPQAPDLTSPKLEWRTEPYRKEHLQNAVLAFAAASARVNRRVVRDARSRGIWVSTATHPHSGDFVTPATLRRGSLAIAVSTGGASPLLAGRIRAKLAEVFDPAFEHWVALLDQLRPLVQSAFSGSRKRAVYEALCDSSWLDRIRREDLSQVRAAMLEQVEALAGTGH
jgi:precorrin-2 dehydrogenase/sirohydrochlorin ferrochelatase